MTIVSNFHNDLLKEVLKPGDNADEVLHMLDKRGFYLLSEEVQLYLLCAESLHHDRSVWQIVLRNNKVNTMIDLLPLTPLFAFEKDNVPQYKWIKSPTWMHNILYDQKLRWKPRCKCQNHNQPSNDVEQVCALTKVAFTMLAAELFCEQLMDHSKYSLHCLLYLLQVAPKLLTIKVPRANNQTQLISVVAVFTCYPDILDILVGKVSFTGIVGETLKRVQMPFAREWRTIHRFVIETVARGNDKEIRQYRDNTGSSILHYLCEHIECPFLLYFLKRLLHIGLDPRHRNNDNQTALDVLIGRFVTDFWAIIQFERRTDIDHNHFLARNFIQAVHMLLPWFKDTPVAQIKLPELRSTYLSRESINSDCTTLGCAVLDKRFFPNHYECYLRMFLGYSWDMIRCKKNQYPCLNCKKLVGLIYEGLHKGLDLNKHITKHGCGRQVTLLEEFVRWPLGRKYRSKSEACTCHIGSATSPAIRPESCDCCAWQLLELLVHCTCRPNLTHMVTSPENVCRECLEFSLLDIINCMLSGRRSFTISNISCIFTLIWMYHSADKLLIMDYLEKLFDGMSDSGDRIVVGNLQDMMLTVRPLKLLCRICVLQHVQWKDIKQLPMPTRLKLYLEIGDISANHVVYQVL